MRRPSALAALEHRDFRLIWLGQFISVVGTQVQTVALAWLVYDLTGSPAQLGAVSLARAVPVILLSLFGGTLADQVDRRKLLLVSQSTLATLTALLALIVTAGVENLAILYGFAFLTAAAGAFDGPTRQAIIPSLVPRARLSNALTLNVLAWDLAAVLGPSLGGLVIGSLGVSVAFWIDAASFMAVVSALVLMRSRPPVPTSVRRGLPALVDGLRFVRQRAILWQLMLIDFLGTVFASSLGLLPVFARDVLAVGPNGLGLLYAAPSAGAVAGATLFAFMPPARRPGRVVALSIAGYGLVLALFGMSQTFVLALLFLALSGALDAVGMAMRHTVRQLATPDDYRGRVGALSSVFSGGGPRLGDFQAGLAASLIGARGAMIVGGSICLTIALASRFWGRHIWSYRTDDAMSESAPISATPVSPRVPATTGSIAGEDD